MVFLARTSKIKIHMNDGFCWVLVGEEGFLLMEAPK